MPIQRRRRSLVLPSGKRKEVRLNELVAAGVDVVDLAGAETG